MTPKKLSDLYYTAQEARTVLGLDVDKFQYWVRSGRIQGQKIPGRTLNVYLKRDIDALALAMEMLFDTDERLVFSRSMPGDQVEEMDIGIRCFGSEYITPLPERIAFQMKSEFTFWSLKVYGHVVGYISLFRLPPDFLDDLLVGRKIERAITIKEVLPFTRNDPFAIYIDVLATDPNVPAALRHRYTREIVAGFARAILNLLANHYQIRALYTVTTSKEGDNLVQRRGFHLMEGKSQAPGRLAYELLLDEAGIKQLQNLVKREG